MSGGSIDFYGVAAQIVPVLVLAVLLEQRAVRRTFDPLLALFVASSAVLAAAFAEILAFELYRGHAASTDQYFVIAPIGYLALVIVFPIIATHYTAVTSSGSNARVVAARCILAVVCLGIALAALAVTQVS